MMRYLITTADERSWKFDRPVLFLGQWCLLYDRKHVWQGLDAEVAAPYGTTLADKDRDLAYVQSLSSELMPEIAAALNRFHNTDHGRRYWDIIIAQWLQRYVAVAFNRYQTISQALETYDISGTTLFESASYSLATNDSLEFIWACNDDEWNNVFYGDVIRCLPNIAIEKDEIALTGKPRFTQPTAAQPAARRSVKAATISAVTRWLPRLVRKKDAFITNTYLPPKLEAALELSLGQAPQLWKRESLPTKYADSKARNQLQLPDGNHQGFELFVRRQFASVIPTCYVEGYAGLVEQSRHLPWPSRPKFIFTSNNFDTDETFKVWAASKSETGIPYFTGQHGNNYGTLKGSENWPETVTPDAFYTWGWSNGAERNVPAFLFKTAGRKSPPHDPDGGLLLIELPLPHRLNPHDSYHEFGTYQEEQFRFVEALPERIKSRITVRLHPVSKQMRWYENARWAECCPMVRMEDGAASIARLIGQSRLIMHSYDSTGILETLAWNLPTMCFWQNGLDHLLPHARPYYELLRECGILADTPEQAATMTAERWDKTAEWWQSPAVQSARARFCAEYARTDKTPVRTLKRLLLSRARGPH